MIFLAYLLVIFVGLVLLFLTSVMLTRQRQNSTSSSTSSLSSSNNDKDNNENENEKKKSKRKKKTAFVVVLGDLGRSPRMNYHCLSLVHELDYQVCLIGYTNDSAQLSEIESLVKENKVKIISLATYPKILQTMFAESNAATKIVQYAFKALFLAFTLLIGLMRASCSSFGLPRFVLVQNPPSIPTLPVVSFFAWLVDAKFLIDWHNYGFTIMALNNASRGGGGGLMVRVCKQMELFFGRFAHLNFCVTEAMRENLARELEIPGAVCVYDKAHERFSSVSEKLTVEQKHAFFLKLARTYKIDSLLREQESDENDEKKTFGTTTPTTTPTKTTTIFTELDGQRTECKKNRPVLMVSSSSWTEDEDFDILVDAFVAYQNEKNNQKKGQNKEDKPGLPDLVCILTGKGPFKSYYEAKFASLNLANIQVHFVWLESNDYPLLLSVCDVGLCFHKSSSNLDLPMKVVDMFGARLPVLCLEFACISELVKSNENGLLFSDEKQLANHLIALFKEKEEDTKDNNNINSNLKLASFRRHIQANFSNWSVEWNSKLKSRIEAI
jgi:beta-1,4-mannosyltransferase